MRGSLPEAMARLVEAIAPAPTPLQEEMAAYATEIDFPFIGPESGAVLRLLARIVEAESIFEFGSGFGYSATWFAGALPPTGEIVLTEVDADELELGREYLERAGLADQAIFEVGDALEIVERYDGPFDVVLIDHDKDRYLEAFEAARDRLAPGGVVIADNTTGGPYEAAAIADGLNAESFDTDNESLAGIVAYLDHVRTDPDFDTSLLPIGKGLTVSCKQP